MTETQDDTKPKLFVFVLMPFNKTFKSVYELGIQAACKNAGAYCERVDEQIFDEPILDRIYNQIAKADLIVAELTGRNPNVFYETGYAHALGKRVILLTQNTADIVFDLNHFTHIVYKEDISKLRDELEKRIRWIISNPKGSLTTIENNLEVATKGSALGGQVLNIPVHKSSRDLNNIEMQFDFHNPGSRVVESDSYQLALITSSFFISSGPFGVQQATPLPDGRMYHQLANAGRFFPNGWNSVAVQLYSKSGDYPSLTGEKMALDIFSEIGPREIQFNAMLIMPLNKAL